jgi:hypothetical protein
MNQLNMELQSERMQSETGNSKINIHDQSSRNIPVP